MSLLKAYIICLYSMQLLCCFAYKNILFIVSDDLRPQINDFLLNDNSPVLSFPKMNTPNLDKLSKRSIIFQHAYCQYPLCSPSRSSVMTGRRPDSTRVYDLRQNFRIQGGDFVTIPQYFKEKGYTSLGVGKIFHTMDNMSWTKDQIPLKERWHKPTWKKLSEKEVRDQSPHDESVTKIALELLDELRISFKNQQTPFFLAVGYRKPHLPFIVPDQFFQYYEHSKIRIPTNLYLPEQMPLISFNSNQEFHRYDNNFPVGLNETVPSNWTKELRLAYYAAVSYVDSLIGKVLYRLKENGLSDDTIIVFWGDHGYHLGENGSWGKRMLFEVDNRVPLILHIPGMTDTGIVTKELVELVDIFPTLVEAAGFPPLARCPKYSQNTRLCREGNSLLPLIQQPANSEWKKAAFSQTHFPHSKVHKYKFAGYSVKTNRYRYTEWHPFDKTTYRVDWTAMEAVELYDHFEDPGETKNIALDTHNQNVVRKLRKLLHTMDKTRNHNDTKLEWKITARDSGSTDHHNTVMKRDLSDNASGGGEDTSSLMLDTIVYMVVVIIFILFCLKNCYYRLLQCVYNKTSCIEDALKVRI